MTVATDASYTTRWDSTSTQPARPRGTAAPSDPNPSPNPRPGPPPTPWPPLGHSSDDRTVATTHVAGNALQRSDWAVRDLHDNCAIVHRPRWCGADQSDQQGLPRWRLTRRRRARLIVLRGTARGGCGQPTLELLNASNGAHLGSTVHRSSKLPSDCPVHHQQRGLQRHTPLSGT
jgi:hypothetical protein